MAIQVSQALTQFGYYKQDIADIDTDVFVSWCQYIERDVFRRILKVFPDKFARTQAYTVINGTQSLPEDFYNIRSQGTGFYLTQNGSIKALRLPQTYVGSQVQGFYFEGTDVVFTGFNESQTYTLRYIPKLINLVDEDSYFTLDTLISGIEIIPEEFMDFLVKALDVYYTQWDAMPNDEVAADQRYLKLVNEFLENYLPTPNIYPMEDDFTTYSFNGGFYNSYPGYNV